MLIIITTNNNDRYHVDCYRKAWRVRPPIDTYYGLAKLTAKDAKRLKEIWDSDLNEKFEEEKNDDNKDDDNDNDNNNNNNNNNKNKNKEIRETPISQKRKSGSGSDTYHVIYSYLPTEFSRYSIIFFHNNYL